MKSKYQLVSLGILLLTSCGSLSRKHTNLTAKANAEMAKQTLTFSKGQKTSILLDSNYGEYDLELKSLGSFTYDSKNGFKGQASSLRLKGKLSGSTKQLHIAHTQLAVHEQMTHKSESSLVNRTKEIVKPARSGKWFWASISMVMLFVLYFVYRKPWWPL